jgi:hypothetical protein
MREFAGSQPAMPLVGDVVGLRTFRIDESGALLPLHSDGVWYDGPNTAICSPPTGHHPRGPHPVPDESCECGFYAYGTEAAAAQNRNCRHVRAVVSCWGGVVAGTKGFRAEHARVDAIWISDCAPIWLRRRVAVRYPSARLYNDPAAMLAEHPLTELDCYRGPARRRAAPAVVASVAGAALVTLGLLPFETLRGYSVLWDIWIAVLTLGVAFTTWLLIGTRDAGHFAAAFVAAGVVAWLVAPAFGMSGWLLRVPLLRGIVVGAGGYLLGLRPHHFPVVRLARERAFCGVRP